MILKSTLKNKIENLLGNQLFLIISCGLIFLLSILLRSLSDIGADTGAYIEVGKRIAQGKKYYHDFLDGNFPLSFYFYALEYEISTFTKINPIILSEIIINFCALFSIFISSKILKKTTIYENKIYYNLILISYFLGFFLRYPSLEIKEFGTKSSLLLIAFYPYLSYSFFRENPFKKLELFWRGLLMGVISCLKPHYLILIIFIEAFRFSQVKNIKFFFELDKLIMALIGCLYLYLIIKFIPEFFELNLPLWTKLYPGYSSWNSFFNNNIKLFVDFIIGYSFIFLAFAKIKPSYDDKILITATLAATALILIENIGSTDQFSVLYAIYTTCLIKLIFDIFTAKEFVIHENKFIIFTVIILPLFDMENVLPALGIYGAGSIWWLIAIFYPFYLSKKLSEKIFCRKNILISLFYLFSLLIGIFLLKFSINFYSIFSAFLMWITFFIFEKRNKNKNFSSFTIFLIITSFSLILYSYANIIFNSARNTPNKLSDAYVYYIKKYAPNKNDSYLLFSDLNSYRFPLVHYLQKSSPSVAYITPYPINENNYFYNSNDFLIFSPIILDAIKQLKNSNIKIIFINNNSSFTNKTNNCIVPIIEYYFSYPEFRKIFLDNFRFENTILISKEKKHSGIKIIKNKNADAFDRLKASSSHIIYNFEVYVRKEN